MNPTTIILDGKSLKRAAHESKAFQLLSVYSAKRERNRAVTDIEQMRKELVEKHGETIDPVDWTMAFERLQEMGLGQLIIGRKGKPTRFNWHYSLKAIGRAALEGINIKVVPITPKLKGGKEVNNYNDSGLGAVPVLTHSAQHGPVISASKEVRAIRQAAPTHAPISQARATHQAPTHGHQAKRFISVATSSGFVFEAELPQLTPAEVDQICSAIKRCV